MATEICFSALKSREEETMESFHAVVNLQTTTLLCPTLVMGVGTQVGGSVKGMG